MNKESLKEDFKNLEVLKSKEPEKYKALTISSLVHFNDEGDVIPFVQDLTSYIKKLSSTYSEGKINLNYPIPKDAEDIDVLTSSLVEDVKSSTEVDKLMVEARFKSLVQKTLDKVKDAGFNYVESKKEEDLENCLGYFDQLMILNETAVLIDSMLK